MPLTIRWSVEAVASRPPPILISHCYAVLSGVFWAQSSSMDKPAFRSCLAHAKKRDTRKICGRARQDRCARRGFAPGSAVKPRGGPRLSFETRGLCAPLSALEMQNCAGEKVWSGAVIQSSWTTPWGTKPDLLAHPRKPNPGIKHETWANPPRGAAFRPGILPPSARSSGNLTRDETGCGNMRIDETDSHIPTATTIS